MVDIKRNGHRVKASWLFNNLSINQFELHHGILSINGQLCYLSASKVKNHKGLPELQIIVSFNKLDVAQSLNNERWQIEPFFKVLKSGGFNIKDTHLTDIDRISKMLAMIIFAFIWAYLAGIYLDAIRPIEIKKHGRRAKSLFKVGLVFIANALFSNEINKFIDCCKFLSCT